MTPIVKDPENAAAPAATGIPAAPVANAPARPQPVALEVPVTVNGARSADGSDKREPFSERSQTVLVFGHGAVLRISALLAPGQLVFLTNEKTKKEVVCVVVKSKTDGNAVGYVELRFTEPAPGFWGMRFPSDTVLPQAAARPAVPASVPAPPKAAPVAPPVAAKPVVQALPIALKPVVVAPPVPVGVSPEIPKTTVTPIPAALPVVLQSTPVAEAASPSVASAPLFAPTDSKLVISSALGATSASANQSTEELKQQAARLQEQLSSLLFAEAPKTPTSMPSPTLENTTAPELAQKVLDLTNFAPVPVVAQPVKSVAPPRKTGPSSLEVEEIKIPSWLAPLARESETQAVVESSSVESNSFAEVESVVTEVAEDGSSSEAQESPRRPEVAIFGGQLLGESSQSADAAPSSSKTGLFLGIAASLLLIAGGVWYSRQPGNAISGLLGGSSTASQPADSSAVAPEPAIAKPIKHPEALASSSSPTPAPVIPPAPVVSAAVKNTPPAPAPRNTSSISTPSPTSSPRNTPPVQEPKKPALGDVRLATPVINRGKTSSTPSESEPSFDVSASASDAAPLSALSTSHRSEPAAPVPIGGDVKPAKLIKSVQPVYPAMAKSQHVSGNIQIDALIDADGNVSAMKVLSGPALLREAALQSLKQWKYQPAELDGKPTSMHLTVTLQFRAQ
ncbi:MAG TPA: TonB family protein [Candidatus Acidoferrales bacterium]|jgi:protein TonB|nr:TonB family protein [Candidatus Acidoferrales bacterium]